MSNAAVEEAHCRYCTSPRQRAVGVFLIVHGIAGACGLCATSVCQLHHGRGQRLGACASVTGLLGGMTQQRSREMPLPRVGLG